MSRLQPPPTADELWNRYAALLPAAKTVLRLKSLIVPAVGKTAFLNCLTQTGRGWSSRKMSEVLEELLHRDLLTPDGECPPGLVHPVAADAMRSADAPVLLVAVRIRLPPEKHAYYGYGQQYDETALYRLIRLAVYANDADAFAENCKLYGKLRTSRRLAEQLPRMFATSPPDWLAERQAPIQLALFDARLSAFLTTGVPAPDLAALIAHMRAQQDREGFASVRRALLNYDLLAGRVDDVRRAGAAIEDGAGVPIQVLSGTLAFLAGNNAAALPLYREGLRLHRKRTGKRKLFLDGADGIFFVMALLASDDPAVAAEVNAVLEIISAAPNPLIGGYAALRALSLLKQGLETQARTLLSQLRTHMPDEPLSAACVALAEFTVDPTASRKHVDALARRFEQLRDLLPLVARIYAEILEQVASGPRYTAWLADTGAGIGLRFTGLIALEEPWQRALHSLDAFLVSGSTERTDKAVARRSRRLAWFVDPETRVVEVVEQSPKGADGWTDGRPVGLHRLHAHDPRLDYLTEPDRRVASTIRREAGGWHAEDIFSFDPTDTIMALVGHPAVFDARHRMRALELVAALVELVVTERPRGYHVVLSHSADDVTLFLEAETPTRFRVIAFSDQLLTVQEILGRGGMTVPKHAHDQVIALARRNSTTLPVRAEIDEIDQAVQEGQPAPVVQLLPNGAGLKVSLLVRPFGATGPAYVAALGGRSVRAVVKGTALRANRDLPREVAERTALIDACPTLRDRLGSDAHEVVVDDLEGCLELLLELQAYAGPVSLEWPEGRTLQVSPVAANRLRIKVSRDRDWFGVEGTLAVDEGEVLDMRFLLDRLERIPGRFVRLDDGRFVALTRQLQAQLGRLSAVSEPHKDGQRVHALGAPALQELLAEAGTVETDQAWKKHIARIDGAERWTPKLPPTLQAELRDYQVEGFVWLSRLARWGAGACLADDMGLGKTVQAIAVILDRAEEGPALVVAPTSVCPNWVAEMARFAPVLTIHRLSAAGDRAALVAKLGPRDVLVCSYGLLHQEAELLGGVSWQIAVLDEAQAIKNTRTKRAQASLSLQAGFRLALTGTPVENYLEELWSLFSFVNPGLLGAREAFQKRFASPIERDGDTRARQALRALVRPFLLRRTKAAVLSELPPRTEQTMTIEMDGPERVFYEALRQRALESIGSLEAAVGRRKIHILAEITRLRRACCNPALIDPGCGVASGKLEAFLQLVEELIRNRHRALVFSQFTGHLALVRAALDARGITYEYLDGSTPSAEREKRVAAFQGGRADLFLISLRAGGTGLNLTAADYVVHLDPWWNPAVEDQASDRAHRIGQERPVTIYRLIMQDSIEERIVRLHRDKRDLASELLEGAEASARLSEDELMELIRL